MKIRILLALIFVVALSPLSALACACCADPGTYMNYTSKLEEYEIGLLGEMRFAPQSELFMTEADFEIIKGLNPIKAEAAAYIPSESSAFFKLDAGFAARKWKLAFTTPAGKKGTLTLPLPAKMTKFKVDIREKRDEGSSVLLYKEFRFNGIVQSGSGFFSGGMTKPVKYQLVLQGRGNGCDNSEDFTHWILDIDGPRADYRLMGTLGDDRP
jgi:hypothetical protein